MAMQVAQNRAQRRAALRQRGKKPRGYSVRNGRQVEMQNQPDMGHAVAPLERPIAVGEISGPEAVEIRALNELVSETEKEYTRWQRLVTVTRNQRVQFLKRIVEAKGLDMRNVYSVNDESGVIVQTHRFIEPEPPDEGAQGEDVPAEPEATLPALAVVPELEPKLAAPRHRGK